MSRAKTGAVIFIIISVFLSAGSSAQTLEENWNDFLHYVKIGRLDLAKGYAQAILQSSPDPEQLLALSKENPAGYQILLKVTEAAPDTELTALSRQILGLIEKGRFIRRADPRIIAEEIRRLSSTQRGWFTAVKRLHNAGEYAIPYMLKALADPDRKEEFPNIVRALAQMGRDAIRPLVTALQGKDVAVKAEIIKALGKIGYLQSLPYLKYIVENDGSAELRALAAGSIREIDPAAAKHSAAELFYQLAQRYYYHAESLAPAEEADFGNIWFWDSASGQLTRKEVDRSYFYELMAMRVCEWALRADAGFGQAIGLWLAGFFKAESAGLVVADMPDYFGPGHPDALVYATTAGPEYLHQALARAIKDNNAYVALGAVEALATTAGEKSLFYRIGVDQPLVAALSFEDRAVRYSAAIAIASAGPQEAFAGRELVVRNLAEAISSSVQQGVSEAGAFHAQLADSYALRAAKVMLQLAQSRNPVIDLSPAQGALISAIQDKRPEIQVLVAEILSYLDSPDAQRAIAAMALNGANTLAVRTSAFESLATSAKLHANMLIEPMVEGIYKLISSADTDPELRRAAAHAYGALNLPSQKVKDLILDQARS